MSKGKKEPPKVGNERRVGRKQISNAGSSEVCASGISIFTKGTQTETSETRHEE
jgi:hypothetical protein